MNLHDKNNPDCDTGTGAGSESGVGGDINESETSRGGNANPQGTDKPKKNKK